MFGSLGGCCSSDGTVVIICCSSDETVVIVIRSFMLTLSA